MSRIKLAGIGLLIVMVGVWAVRSFVVGGSGDSTSPAASSPASTPRADARSDEPEEASDPVAVVAAGDVAGIPVGYPPSDRGAATAAVNWVTSFPTIVRMGPLRLADTMTELLSAERSAAGSEEVVTDYFELFDTFGAGFAERIWVESPLQVDVGEASSTTANVRVWAVLVTGDSTSGPVEAVWRTHHVSLVWERSDWRIDDVVIVEGPTPVPASGALPSEAAAFDQVDTWAPAVFADTTSLEVE